MNNRKEFLEKEYIPLLKKLKPDTKGNWGLMNCHQMVEHMIYSFRVANGNLKIEKLMVPEEHISKMQSWVLSNKPMRENIHNPLLSEIPPQPENNDYTVSVSILESEIMNLMKIYEQNPNLEILNPFYGNLNFNLNINLLYKHAVHHLRQFGIELDYIEE
ncbi:MAG: hypothetical protein ABI851_01035 [Saprospiraceae bacterium]